MQEGLQIKMSEEIQPKLNLNKAMSGYVVLRFEDDSERMYNFSSGDGTSLEVMTQKDFESAIRAAFKAACELDVQCYGASGTGGISGPFDKPEYVYARKYETADDYLKTLNGDGSTPPSEEDSHDKD